MGPEDLSGALTAKAARPASRRRLRILWAACVLAPAAAAQTPFSRAFEDRFLYRLELAADRALDQAPARIAPRLAALYAEERRAQGSRSLAGERAEKLLALLARARGFDEDDPFFRIRGDFRLHVLPEVVDPKKTGRDLKRVLEIASRIYPLLDPRLPEVADDAVVPGAGQIHLTAQGAFSWRRPKDWRFAFEILDAGGRSLRHRSRGDAAESDGWLRHEIHVAFDTKGLAPGRYRGRLRITIGGKAPRPGDPAPEGVFWLHPGFHAAAWKLFSAYEALLHRTGPKRPPLASLARLDVLCKEVGRALLGDPYTVRSWPIRALREGLRLAAALENGERPAKGKAGDRVYGVPLAGGGVLPVRIVWRRGPDPLRERFVLYFPPAGWNEDFALEGLGLDAADLVPPEGGAAAFLHLPGGDGYLAGVQRLLAREFGARPERTVAVGVGDGAVRARFGLGRLEGPLAAFAAVGWDLPGPDLLTFAEARELIVVAAWGRPAPAEFERFPALLERITGRRRHPQVRLDPENGRPRSFRAALVRLFPRPR